MNRRIYKLKNYTFQDENPGSEAIERTSFIFIANEYLWKKFDIEGHYTLDEALDLSKNLMVDDLIKMALKESVRSLSLKSKDFHFEKDGRNPKTLDFASYAPANKNYTKIIISLIFSPLLRTQLFLSFSKFCLLCERFLLFRCFLLIVLSMRYNMGKAPPLFFSAANALSPIAFGTHFLYCL